jgi:5-(carboxyamino)imidazole ribonucleotide synthase
MLALAGIPLGHRFRILDPAERPPAAALAEHIRAEFDDPAALKLLAAGADVVTYEFENVPHHSVRMVAATTPVHPSPDCLAVAQERLAEKQAFVKFDIPTPRFAPIDGPEDIAGALAAVGLPCVVKTRRSGYDGKGQRVIRALSDAEGLWQDLGSVPLIAEEFVSFTRELSILSVRDAEGHILHYPLNENVHESGILRQSLAPAVTPLQRRAEQYSEAILEHFGYVGVLCIEFFEADGRLQANEMAPRVHNSGHWTIEGSICSQFENHIRAICRMPLGSPALVAPSAMLNMIGVLPDVRPLLARQDVHVHVYDKPPRPGSKIGHVTFRGANAWQDAKALRASKAWPQA